MSSVIGTLWLDFWRGEDRDRAEEAIAKARAGGTGRFSGLCATTKGREKWWECIITPIRDEQGRPERLLSVSRDVTQSKQAEQHRELLLAELDHRVKNILATVQSMAVSSLPCGAATQSYVGRVQALAHVHRLLAQTSWDGACLAEMAAVILEPYAGRVRTSGAPLRLRPQAAQALAIAIQELLTNAVKYGALSVEAGSVELSWKVTDDAVGRVVCLDWRETGGPVLSQPERKGFGTTLIERGVSYELGGSVRLLFAPEGLRCTIEFPFSEHVARFRADGQDGIC